MTMQEEWSDIEEYSGLYQISNLGNVKSLNYNHTGKEKMLKASKRADGYLQVELHKQWKRKKYLVHRLVGKHFIPNPQNLPQLNHRNEIKTDNRVENLEWCTAKYNINFGTRNQRVAESETNHPKRSKQVMCIETSVVYPSTMEIKRQFGFSQGNISSACNGKRKQAYGFHWKYVS